MTDRLLPPDASPLSADHDAHVAAPFRDSPPPAGPATDRALATGLLLTILFFGIPLLLYCVLTSG
ncbi:MAG: hypothetical protein PGN16_01460 [Sphingomonas phyllosphaerae]